MEARTPPMCTTMNPANNATMFKPCNSTNAAANIPQMIAIFATSARIHAPSALPPLAPRELRSTLCAKYAVGTRLLIPPTNADSTAARPNGIEAAAAVAVSRHWTQKTRLINGRFVRQCAPHWPRTRGPASPPDSRAAPCVRTRPCRTPRKRTRDCTGHGPGRSTLCGSGRRQGAESRCHSTRFGA